MAVTDVSARQNIADSLQDLLLATEDVENFLKQLVDVAAATIPAEVSAGITLARDGHPMTVASSDADAARYDEVQYGHDEGPCLASMRTGEVLVIEDLAQDERFGDYRAHALALGVRSALSLPLHGGEDAVGALNLYANHTHAFGAQQLEVGRRFADEASRALTMAVRLARHAELSAQLQAALTSRAVIDQAIGVVMGQNRCDAEEAFAILRTASQHRNVKLRTVAQEIVTAVSRGSSGKG
ncbi:GAF domain-containing protein [Georgenia satyanarayanai]|uniref:GAF domain-containing protein n=1 Tax=Georgenia satyanarayanai TaxID=860221 RepID=A0A2Y9AKA5_9MICO|nr:GAF and ANTAR domain-containing protein [Georgenia satyanarayanai]PYF98353.1 GAF domain-containing protein [Georgenia satyanarayanai]SSA44941.1 GAF domain-containing protein [Georgenia satyanarayanai]